MPPCRNCRPVELPRRDYERLSVAARQKSHFEARARDLELLLSTTRRDLDNARSEVTRLTALVASLQRAADTTASSGTAPVATAPDVAAVALEQSADDELVSGAAAADPALLAALRSSTGVRR